MLTNSSVHKSHIIFSFLKITMSPSKFQGSDVTKGVINGPNPSTPLRINKESHVSTKNSGTSAKRQPVIIYTHAPKVIHAQARDFMAIVQKLTGMSRADAEDTAVKLEVSVKDEDLSDDQKNVKNNNVNNIGFPENETVSDLIDDCRFVGSEMKHHESSSSPISSMYKVSNTYLVDAPLFTPNSNEYFCSSRSNPFLQSSSISPSFMDYTRGFSDY